MRKVSVSLEADVAGFIRPVETATRSVDDLGDKIDSLDHSLNKIPADAVKAGAAMKLLDGDARSVGRTVNDLGTKNTGLAVLDVKIRDTQKEVRKLADEFTRTGDVDIFRRLGDAEGRLRGLRDTRKKLADAMVVDPNEAKGFFKRLVDAAGQAGSEAGEVFSGGITGALSTPVIGPAIAAALIAAVGAAAVAVGAAAGGAVLAAAGGGAIGLGIMGAIMGDPTAISAAWGKQVDELEKRWMNASAVFQGPLLDAAGQFGLLVRHIDFDRMMAKAASYMPELVRGAAGFARYVSEAAEQLIDAAGPSVTALSHELPKLGLAVKAAGDQIAGGADGGATAMQDLVQGLEIAIVATGVFIGKASDLYGALSKLHGVLTPDWFDWKDLPPQITQVGRVLDDLGSKAQGTVVSVRGLSDAWGELRREELAYADAGLAVKQGWFDLEKALKDGKRTLDTNTEAGVANTRALLDQIEVAERAREQQVALTGDVQAADAVYQANVERIRAMAYALGFNKQQVDALITSVAAIPPAKSTTITTPGLGTALDQGIALGNALNNIDGDYYARVHVTGIPSGISLGNLLHHADGGPVYAGVASIVGERGPEVFVPHVDGSIVPSVSQFAAMATGPRYTDMRSTGSMAWSGGGGGGGEVTHRLIVETKDGLELLNTILNHPLGPSRLSSSLTYLRQSGQYRT